jgi:hypothetical protein
MHDMWKDMFVLALPIMEKVLRPIVVYAFLVISLRLSGKRELVQLNPFDLVVLLTLSNTVQNAIIGDDNSVTGGNHRRDFPAGRKLSGRALPLQSPFPGSTGRRKGRRANRGR